MIIKRDCKFCATRFIKSDEDQLFCNDICEADFDSKAVTAALQYHKRVKMAQETSEQPRDTYPTHKKA